MKQSVAPGVVIGVIVAGVVVIGLIALWVFKSPSASAPNLSPAEAKAAQQNQMKESHGPSEDEKKQIQEWKRQHPGSFTKN